MINLDKENVSFLETARFDGNNRQWGMSGGFQFLTDITSVKNGAEKRNAVYKEPRGTWEIGNRGVTEKENFEIQSFLYTVGGKHTGFRFRDWLDYKDEGAGVMELTTDLTYQMFKKREIKFANAYRLQKIIKPVGPTFESFPDLGNTIQFFWNGVEIIQSTGPFSFTLDDTKGIAVFNPATLIVNVDAGGVYTSIQKHNLKINDGIKFNRSDVVVDTYIIEIIDEYKFRVNYSESFSATNLETKPYPNSSSDLKWTGLFDKAVRFDTDEILVSGTIFNELESGETIYAVQLPSIPIIELPK